MLKKVEKKGNLTRAVTLTENTPYTIPSGHYAELTTLFSLATTTYSTLVVDGTNFLRFGANPVNFIPAVPFDEGTALTMIGGGTANHAVFMEYSYE